MNEPGVPGTPPANLPTSTPPSYLRPATPAPHSLSTPLLLIAVLFAIIGITAFCCILNPMHFSWDQRIDEVNANMPPPPIPPEGIEYLKSHGLPVPAQTP